MVGEPDGALRDLLALAVPGSPLREGLERILGAHMGALVVLGDGPDVLAICSGGFHIDAEMSPQRLSELAKMDGAIVLDQHARRIAWANVHLIPDPAAPTTETGTRHRTAERVARSLGVPVVAVSEENGTITLYRGRDRRQLQDTDSLLGRANHLLQGLERFRARFEEADLVLAGHEVSGTATFRLVALLVQRLEMVHRLAGEAAEQVAELGARGRLLRLQLDELVAGPKQARQLLLLDYLPLAAGQPGLPAVRAAVARLEQLATDDLLNLEQVATALLGPPVDGARAPQLDSPVVPRGYRLLRQSLQLPAAAAEQLVVALGDLDGLRRASPEELAAVVGDEWAGRLRVELAGLEAGRSPFPAP